MKEKTVEYMKKKLRSDIERVEKSIKKLDALLADLNQLSDQRKKKVEEKQQLQAYHDDL